VGRRWYYMPHSIVRRSRIIRSKIYKLATDITHAILGVVFSLTVVLGDTFFRFLGLYGILYFTLYQLVESETFDEVREDLCEFLMGIAVSPFIYIILMILGVVK
jgi:hypothetical protein